VDKQDSFDSDLKVGLNAVLAGQESEGIAALLRAKSTRPDDPEVNFWLFQAYSKIEKPNRAAKAFFFAKKTSRLCAGTPMGDQADQYIQVVERGPATLPHPIEVPERSGAEPVAIAPRDKSIDREYLQDARQALDGLRALKSVVTVGVSYSDYPTRVQDARINVDRFLDRHPREQIPGLHQAIRSGMGCFEDAMSLWSVKFEGDGVEEFIEESSPTMTYLFRRYPRFRSDLNRDGAKTEFGYFIGSGISTLWAYADDKITIIERALSD